MSAWGMHFAAMRCTEQTSPGVTTQRLAALAARESLTTEGLREVPVLLGLPRAGHGDKFRVLDPVGADGGDVDAPEEQLVVERLGVAVQKGLRGGVDP